MSKVTKSAKVNRINFFVSATNIKKKKNTKVQVEKKKSKVQVKKRLKLKIATTRWDYFGRERLEMGKILEMAPKVLLAF